MFKLSFNCNKQVLKINFKPLFKWTFVQNQSCRVLKIKKNLCSNIFKLLCKKWRKVWISKCIGHFQMHSSFKIPYLKRSLKWICAWNKSCSIWSFEQLSYSKVFRLTSGARRKVEFTNWTLELRVNNESAITTSLPPLFPLTPWWRRADAVRRHRH